MNCWLKKFTSDEAKVKAILLWDFIGIILKTDIYFYYLIIVKIEINTVFFIYAIFAY